MYILGVVGSPRKGRNTDTLTDLVLDKTNLYNSDTITEKVFLNDLEIKPCQGCLSCMRLGQCCQADDMAPVYEKVVNAQAIVFGTPVYWWGPSAQMKLFLDRLIALWNKRKIFQVKKCAVVCTYADPDPNTPEHLFGMFNKAASYLKMELVGNLGVCVNFDKEVKNDSLAVQNADNLARALTGYGG